MSNSGAYVWSSSNPTHRWQVVARGEDICVRCGTLRRLAKWSPRVFEFARRGGDWESSSVTPICEGRP